MNVDVALLTRPLVALVAIFGVLYALQAVLRRAGRWRMPGSPGSLRVRESLFLPEGASVHVIEVVGRRYLIGRATGAVSLLCEMPVSPHVPGPDSGIAPAPAPAHAAG